MFSSVRFLCLEEEKSSEFVQAESREPGSFFFFFFLVRRVPRAFTSLGTIYKVVALLGLPPSNGFGLG